MIIIKFKAPTFANTQSGVGPFPSSQSSDVRYWSMCSQNLTKNETLNCLPDHLAKVDNLGFVTLVVGAGAGLREAAEQRKYNFLEDTRQSNQSMIAFAYRNIMPSQPFQTDSMYRGDYLPKAKMCSNEKFLSDQCGE